MKKKSIQNSEISVIVQGPIFGNSMDITKLRYTLLSLKSIRKYLPGAEIILSTWFDSDISDLDYDYLVLNSDPGKIDVISDGNRIPYNINRQIVSTKNGILKSNRKYILKIRSDVVLKGDKIIKLFDIYTKRCENFKLLSKRVITSNVSAFNPNKNDRRVFNPSDWIYFGLRSDILKIWNIDLMNLDELDMKISEGLYDQKYNISGEQFLWLNLIKKEININLPYMRYITDELVKTSEISIVNNLVIYSNSELRIESKKYLNNSSFIKFKNYSVYYSHQEWKQLYKKYCDNNIILIPDYKLKIYYLKKKYLSLLKKILKKENFK
jgi:hypothetical protein